MPVLPRRLDGVHDGGELRHADAGDDPRGADRARPDADLDGVGAGIDQRLGAFGGGDIAGDDLHRIGEPLDPPHRVEHAARMAVGGIDDHEVDAGLDQALGALEAGSSPTVVAAATRSRPCSSLQAWGWATAFSMSLTVIRPTQR